MRRMLAVLAALALLLVACGGSGTSTETTASPTATAELPTTTSTLPPSTTTTTPPETTTTLPPATPEPPPPTPTPTPLALVTTGENIPEALSRDLIPWEEVGPGWYLVTYSRYQLDPPAEGPFPQTMLYLVDGRAAGVLYEVTSFDSGADIVDWRLDGSAALVWNNHLRSPTGPGDLWLVDIASGEHRVLRGDHVDLHGLGRNFSLGFTSPEGIHLVASTHDDGWTTESLAYYDLDGNRLQELFSQPYPEEEPLGRLSWLYGVDGLDVVVGHSAGVALVDNRGNLIRDLWVPDDNFCQPVRWWSAGEFLARCTNNKSGEVNRPPHAYWEPWALRTDGTPGEKLAEIPQSGLGDLGYRDAWPTSAGLLVQGSGDCQPSHIKIVTGTQVHMGSPFSLIADYPTVGPTREMLVDVVEERAAIHAGIDCGHPGAFYTYALQTGPANIIIPPIENILGLTSVVGLATVYP